MNSQMTIGKKLFLTFGAVLALTMAISAVSLQAIGNIGGLLRNVIDVNAKMQFLAAELDVVLSDFTAEERGIIRRAEMRDHAAVEKYNKDFDESAARIKARLSEMAALARSAEGQTLLEQIRSASEKIVLNHGEFMRLIRAGNLKAASEFVTATVMPLIKEANRSPVSWSPFRASAWPRWSGTRRTRYRESDGLSSS